VRERRRSTGGRTMVGGSGSHDGPDGKPRPRRVVIAPSSSPSHFCGALATRHPGLPARPRPGPTGVLVRRRGRWTRGRLARAGVSCASPLRRQEGEDVTRRVFSRAGVAGGTANFLCGGRCGGKNAPPSTSTITTLLQPARPMCGPIGGGLSERHQGYAIAASNGMRVAIRAASEQVAVGG